MTNNQLIQEYLKDHKPTLCPVATTSKQHIQQSAFKAQRKANKPLYKGYTQNTIPLLNMSQNTLKLKGQIT